MLHVCAAGDGQKTSDGHRGRGRGGTDMDSVSVISSMRGGDSVTYDDGEGEGEGEGRDESSSFSYAVYDDETF